MGNKPEISSRTSYRGFVLSWGQVCDQPVSIWLLRESTTSIDVKVTLGTYIIACHIFVHNLNQQTGILRTYRNLQNIVERNSIFFFFGFSLALHNLGSELSTLVPWIIFDNNRNIIFHLACEFGALKNLSIQDLKSKSHL